MLKTEGHLTTFPPYLHSPQFKCCGAANYTDWEKIPETMASRVPDSCCVNITNNCGVHFVVKDIHTEVGRAEIVGDLGKLGNVSGGERDQGWR